MDVSGTIRIRAHHLLCIQGFQGHGYSEDFVTNMAQVILDLKSHDRQVEIIAECDVICLPCPHKKDGVCMKNPDSPTEIKNTDMKVLKKLGLIQGRKIKAKDIPAIVKTKLNVSDIEDICGDCSWREKCEAFSLKMY